MNLVKILPMAFVMIAGPQILSAIFLATSEHWRRNSAAYVAGAALWAGDVPPRPRLEGARPSPPPALAVHGAA